jgi:SAM-dependent methyltransferase
LKSEDTSRKSAKQFYSNTEWDEEQWIKIIAIEYESLVAAYPFSEKLTNLADGQTLSLLDIGCGTAIFPRYLDKELSGTLQLECDLLDISGSSIEAARSVMKELDHFSAGAEYQIAIEDIPEKIDGEEVKYHLAWAIHSFTTVDIPKMAAVFESIKKLLRDDGFFFIYQLTSKSAYQVLHSYYTENSSEREANPYMEFEDSAKILKGMDWPYEVYELQFPHKVQRGDEEGLRAYLQKVLLDSKIDPIKLFEAILPDFLVGEEYLFQQSVNLIVAKK